MSYLEEWESVTSIARFMHTLIRQIQVNEQLYFIQALKALLSNLQLFIIPFFLDLSCPRILRTEEQMTEGQVIICCFFLTVRKSKISVFSIFIYLFPNTATGSSPINNIKQTRNPGKLWIGSGPGNYELLRAYCDKTDSKVEI